MPPRSVNTRNTSPQSHSAANALPSTVLSAFSAAKSRLSPKPRSLSADSSRAVLHKSPYAQSHMTRTSTNAAPTTLFAPSSYQGHTASSASRYQHNLQNASRVYLAAEKPASAALQSSKPAPLRSLLTPRKTKRKASAKSSHSSPPGTPMSASSTRAPTLSTSTPANIATNTTITSTPNAPSDAPSHELIATIPNLFNRKLSLKVIQKNCLPIEHACCVHSKYMWIASKTKIAIFDCLTLRPVHQITNRDTNDSITCIQLFHKHVWTGHKSGKISVWNADTRLKVNDLPGYHTKRVNEMIQVGNTVWTVSNDATIRVWDMNTMQHCGRLPHPLVRSPAPQPTAYTSLTLVPDTSSVWIADDVSNLHVFSIRQGRFTHCLSTNFGRILRVKFTNHHVWSASSQGMIQVWNSATVQTAKYFHCHKKAIPCMEVTDSQVWTSSLDKSMHTYDAKELRVIKNLKSKNRALWVGGMALADNSRIWTLCSDNHIRIWSMYGVAKRPALGEAGVDENGDAVGAKEVLQLMERILITTETDEGGVSNTPVVEDAMEEKESVADSISTYTDASSQVVSSRPSTATTLGADLPPAPKASSLQRAAQPLISTTGENTVSPPIDQKANATPVRPTSSAGASLSPHEPSQKSKPEKPKLRQASKESLVSVSSAGAATPPKASTSPRNAAATVQLKKQASQNSAISKNASTLSMSDSVATDPLSTKRRPISPILRESIHELKLDDQAYKTPLRSRDEDIESFEALEKALAHPIEDLTRSLPTSLSGGAPGDRGTDELNLLRPSASSSHAAYLMEPFGNGDESDDSFDTGDNYSITAYEKEVMTLRQQLQDASNRTNRYKERLRDRRSKLEEKQKQLLRLNDKYNQSQTELFVQKERTIELEQRVASLERKTYLDEEYLNRLQKLIPEPIRKECKDIESIVWNVEKVVKDKPVKEQNGAAPSAENVPIAEELEASQKEMHTLMQFIEQQAQDYERLTQELQRKEAQLGALKRVVAQSGGSDRVKMETLTDALVCYSVALREVQQEGNNGTSEEASKWNGNGIARGIVVEE